MLKQKLGVTSKKFITFLTFPYLITTVTVHISYNRTVKLTNGYILERHSTSTLTQPRLRKAQGRLWLIRVEEEIGIHSVYLVEESWRSRQSMNVFCLAPIVYNPFNSKMSK